MDSLMRLVRQQGGPRSDGTTATDVDAGGLVALLRSRLRGEVRFDGGSRALYATDGSNYRQIPIGVVVPLDLEDAVEAMAACREFGAPVLPRGGGTSLAGQCCNLAVVLDFSKYLKDIVELDPEARQARVHPGLILDDLRNAAERHHLTFGPDPATHNHCTLGGMIGNNSCGVHSILAGKTSDNVEELEVLTYDGLRMRVGPTGEEELEHIIGEGGRRGEIYASLRNLRDRYADLIRQRFPDIPRRVSGFALDQLLPEHGFNVARALVGTEATCVMVLEARVRLVHSPPARSLLVLGYPDVYCAGDHVPEILTYGPVGLEGLDDRLIHYMKLKGLHPDDVRLLPEGGGWLMVEFGGESKQESDDQARRCMAGLRRKPNPPRMCLFDDPAAEERLWAVRESGLGATAWVPGMPPTWPGWEDSAVHPTKLGGYLRDLRGLFDRYGYNPSLYGHFGQGCVHCRIDFEMRTAEGIETYKAFVRDAADLVVSYGGSLSGEHGDGQARGPLLARMYGDELVQAFREFKAIWDPQGKMNPGKVVDPYPMDQNLRLGTHYNPPEPRTYFQFRDDEFSFARATLRCVGVGECRRLGGGTMCPSFMVTREEKHSTRGRARLLFEMMQGEAITGGWGSEEVRSALDLCLACKGCKGDCPVNVDMATYKAEFLAHYYQEKPRPVTAYTMGLIYWWGRLAMLAPHLANLVTQTEPFSTLMKALGGFDYRRRIPTFAPQSFRAWFRSREPAREGGRKVVLWPDCLNNYFHPQTGQACVEVLESAGYQVVVPERYLCCGRPLYDYGFLDRARSLLRDLLEALRPEIAGGVPVVGLEPSCVSVFRDEMPNLFPADEDARRLTNQTFLLSEFLEKEGYQPPRLRRKALVHGHCHHKALMGLRDEESLLRKMGLDYRVPDSGCCGMAGAFGFERGEHYEVSQKCGERVLLPEVDGADEGTLIVADGFSCREQIAQNSSRRALHLAEVLHLAMREGERGARGGLPEAAYTASRNGRLSPLETALMVGGAALLAGGAVAWARRHGGACREQTPPQEPAGVAE